MFLERYNVFVWIVGLIAEQNRPEYVDAVDWAPQVFLSVQEYGRQFQEPGKPLDLLSVRWECVIQRARVRLAAVFNGSPISFMEGLV